MLTKEKKTAEALHHQRLHARSSFFRTADVQHDHFARKSGSFMWGTGKDGRRAQSRALRALGIEGPDKDGFVVVGFKRDNIAKLEGIPADEADWIIKKGAGPRKTVKCRLHIIAAVRQEEHIYDGYAKEINVADKVLLVLDALNIKLAEKTKPPEAFVDAAIFILATFGNDVLSKKTSAVKRVASMAKLKKLINKLHEVRSSSNPAFDNSTACRVFVAFRDRLGLWRDEQVAGLQKYNRQKEYALRAERDRWTYSQLMMFVEDVHAAYLRFPPAKLGEEPKIGSPRYILDELVKSRDKYLTGVLIELEQAVDAFEKRSPTARGRFMQARDRLGAIISQQQKN